MRFYRIELTNAKTGKSILPSSLKGGTLSSLLPTGQYNPGALNVVFDIPVGAQHAPSGEAYLQIQGLSVADIGNAFDLNGANVSIYGGMSKGLPLANPAQQGLLLKGGNTNAFGNWIGTDQSVDMVFSAPTGTQKEPMNFVLNWPAGTTLASALANTFSAAIPGAQQDIRISSRLTASYDQPHAAGTLNELASVLNDISKSIIKDDGYPGVLIYYDGQRITATDNTTPNTVIPIAFQDLIGQPTWRGPLLIQMKTVLRGDLFLGDRVSLPQSLVQTTAAAFTRFQPKTSFTGNYFIQGIHHYGNFRQPDGASWATVFDMAAELAAT